MSQLTVNGTYSKLARTLTPGVGKTFLLVPASNSFIPAYQAQYPVDDAGAARVFTTPSAAFAAVQSGRGDRILVHPGSYTVTTNTLVSASGWSMECLGPDGSAVLAPQSVDAMTITGDNWRMKGIGFSAAASLSCVVLIGCDNWVIENCVFTSTVGGAGTYFIKMQTTASSNGLIQNNRFSANLDVSGGAVTMTAHIVGLGNRISIVGNRFDARRQTTANAGAVTDGIVFSAAADWGNVIQRNTFVEHNGATFTAAVNYGTTVTTGGVIQFENNFLLATAANAVVNGANSDGFGSNLANGTV